MGVGVGLSKRGHFAVGLRGWVRSTQAGNAGAKVKTCECGVGSRNWEQGGSPGE